VLSYNFWQSRYGSNSTAVGSIISLNGHPFEVIGVAPAGFYGIAVGSKFDVAAPICAAELLDGPGSRLNRRSSWWLRAGGRLKPGIGMAQLTARLAAVSPAVYESAVPQDWAATLQDKFRKRVLRPIPMSTGVSDLREGYKRPLGILMAVVALVLLIACANIASLFTARSVARAKEMAMRQALGATRLRLIRQLIVECILLSLAGATLGVLFAPLADKALLYSLSSTRQQIFFDFTLDMRVLGFTAVIATLTGLLFGLAPAFRCTRASLADAMKANHAAAGGPRSKLLLWIVSSQVALSLLLLVAAGMLLRTFRNLATADIGFDPDHVLVVNVNLSIAKIPESQFAATYDRIGTALRSLPGATSVARSSLTPLGGSTWNTIIHSDVPNALTGDDALAYFNQVDPHYFEAMRTPLVAGRNFNHRDSANMPLVAVINRTLARTFFPGVNPVGHTYRVGGLEGKLEPSVEVVGVVNDAKYETLREEALPAVFLPAAQAPGFGSEYFELRTPLPQGVIARAIQSAITGVNGAIPFEVHMLSDQVDASITRERALALLSTFFGGLALLLAMIGLYCTLNYLGRQRRAEFAIRVALGATSISVLRLAMADVVALMAVGIPAGVGLSLATTQFLRALLFGIQPRDTVALVIGVTLMSVVSIAAGLLAARRAVRVDAMIELRQD
jgi:predicted permease